MAAPLTTWLTSNRILLVTSPYFGMERHDLAPNTNWQLQAPGVFAWFLGSNDPSLPQVDLVWTPEVAATACIATA